MKCKICGKRFNPKKSERYEVSEVTVGLFTPKAIKITECFDCPRCGCQNALNTRIPKTPQKPSADELEQAFRQGYEQAKKE